MSNEEIVTAALNSQDVDNENDNEVIYQISNNGIFSNGLFDLDEGSKRQIMKVSVEGIVVGITLVIVGIILFTLLKALDYKPFEELNNNMLVFIFVLGFTTHVIYERTGWNYKFCKVILG